jgi:integrase
MVTDWRKVLHRVAERAGWKAGEIRTKRFRHTYCVARLQALDHGAPVSTYTVARELGHSSVRTTGGSIPISVRPGTRASRLSIGWSSTRRS